MYIGSSSDTIINMFYGATVWMSAVTYIFCNVPALISNNLNNIYLPNTQYMNGIMQQKQPILIPSHGFILNHEQVKTCIMFLLDLDHSIIPSMHLNNYNYKYVYMNVVRKNYILYSLCFCWLHCDLLNFWRLTYSELDCLYFPYIYSQSFRFKNFVLKMPKSCWKPLKFVKLCE